MLLISKTLTVKIPPLFTSTALLPAHSQRKRFVSLISLACCLPQYFSAPSTYSNVNSLNTTWACVLDYYSMRGMKISGNINNSEWAETHHREPGERRLIGDNNYEQLWKTEMIQVLLMEHNQKHEWNLPSVLWARTVKCTSLLRYTHRLWDLRKHKCIF